MADNTLKATIQVDMDNRGVAKGVADTKNQLDKLNKTAARTARSAGITAALNVAEVGLSLVKSAAQAVNRRVDELTTITNKFSSAAAGYKLNADLAREDAAMRLATALAPGAMQVERAGADIAAGEAARMERNAEMMQGGMGATARFGQNLMAGMDILTEAAAGQIMSLERLLSGDIGGFFEAQGQSTAFAFSELLNAQNYAMPAQGSARGMAYDIPMQNERAIKALEEMNRKMGGT